MKNRRTSKQRQATKRNFNIFRLKGMLASLEDIQRDSKVILLPEFLAAKQHLTNIIENY